VGLGDQAGRDCRGAQRGRDRPRAQVSRGHRPARLARPGRVPVRRRVVAGRAGAGDVRRRVACPLPRDGGRRDRARHGADGHPQPLHAPTLGSRDGRVALAGGAGVVCPVLRTGRVPTGAGGLVRDAQRARRRRVRRLPRSTRVPARPAERRGLGAGERASGLRTRARPGGGQGGPAGGAGRGDPLAVGVGGEPGRSADDGAHAFADGGRVPRRVRGGRLHRGADVHPEHSRAASRARPWGMGVGSDRLAAAPAPPARRGVGDADGGCAAWSRPHGHGLRVSAASRGRGGPASGGALPGQGHRGHRARHRHRRRRAPYRVHHRRPGGPPRGAGGRCAAGRVRALVGVRQLRMGARVPDAVRSRRRRPRNAGTAGEAVGAVPRRGCPYRGRSRSDGSRTGQPPDCQEGGQEGGQKGGGPTPAAPSRESISYGASSPGTTR
jgi:hypothetical protein